MLRAAATGDAQRRRTPSVQPQPQQQQQAAGAAVEKPSSGSRAASLAFCFFGLQGAYISWGVMQEKVMTTEFTTGRFPSSLFCVLTNRLFAVVIAGVLAKAFYGRLRPEGCGFTQFGWCALSNVVSSAAQYEALRHTAFPLQVLSKSTKVIPVMAMGRVLNQKTYTAAEYIEAIVISAGVFAFAYADPARKEGTATQLTGVALLVLYVVTDSFTSQWQSKLYGRFKSRAPAATLHSHQMMFWVNMWSIFQAASVLRVRGEDILCVHFLRANPEALVYIVANAVCSALGQLVIYYTIRQHGPVVFTMFMTTRQILGILISCALFGHVLTAAMVAAAAVVFGAVLHGVWRKVR
eukprot:TRINITY_DN2614_c2_g1_i1.p1 TRINITY_DN2614_c2_g1~~TRINITY_DN2614_c2_g1_i1.p1  ORF type:complete len:379 (+),score=134.42 TRINITY_DN2614_c2_g1_i1:85-1137(+)